MNLTILILYVIIGLSVITIFKYLIYIFSSPLYLLSRSKHLSHARHLTKKEIEKRVKISVIVPAWNEEVGVVNSIKSLLSSTHNNLEIILVNDGSTDGTCKVVEEFIKTSLKRYPRNGKTFKFYSKKNGGKGSALNYGIKKSTGDLIVTMDADTIFDKNALSVVARYFIDKDLDAAVGNVKVANSKTVLGIIQQVEYTIGFYFKRTHSVFNSEYIIGGAFGVFRKELFAKYGYFDERNKTEDIELSTRLQDKGCKIAFLEDAIAYTEGPTTMKGLMQQRLRWKKGRLDTFYKYRKLFFSKEKKHSKFLTHFLFPLTIFYEIELIFEPLLIFFGIFYLYRTSDFRGLFLWVIFVGIVQTIAFVFGSKGNSKRALAITPIYFILSYVLTVVEIYAMYGSLILMAKREEVKWQSWDRKGISVG